MHISAMRSIVILFVLVGCKTTGSISFIYTPTDNRAATAKPDNCEFAVLTTVPDRAFEEIGVLDLSPKSDYAPSTIPTFRKVTAPDVCAHGGDAVLAQANGFGVYIKGTVLRYTSPSPAVITTDISPAEAVPTAPSP